MVSMAKTHTMPLYHVVVYGLDEAGTTEPVQYRSAAAYAAVLESHGMPATILFSHSVTMAEYMKGR